MRAAQFLAIIGRGSKGSNALENTEDRAGATSEQQDNVINTVNSLDPYGPSWQLVPGNVAAGTVYAQVPTSGTGDLAFTRASTATRTNSAGTIVNLATGVPRIDYRNADGSLSPTGRLLLEPQRTNSIRNSTMVGAVAGTPGTGPTNWVNQQLVGLSRQISLGTENGLSYIDLRFFGTGNANDNLRIDLEGLTQIAAANGQTWAYSLYAKAISGTIPTASFIFLERNIAGSSVTVGGSSFTPTSTLTRFNSIRTLNGGVTVAFVQPSLFFAIVSGATYDFTIRIAAPQMELGTYATTFIRTTTAAVTRLADAFSRSNVYTNGFITSAGGTWFIDLSENLSLQRDSGGAGLFLSTDGNGITNSFNVRAPGGLNRLNIAKYVSGSLTGLFNTTTTKVKIAIKWNGATADIFVNGTKQVSATNFTATQLEFLNQASTGVVKYIDDMALFRAPLTDAQCIQLTTL